MRSQLIKPHEKPAQKTILRWDRVQDAVEQDALRASVNERLQKAALTVNAAHTAN